MSRALAACAALLCLLVVAAPASAERGLWDGTKGVQPLHFATKPILVKPGQNSINNIIVPPAEKPKVDGYIVRGRPDLPSLDGTVPPVASLPRRSGAAGGGHPPPPRGMPDRLRPAARLARRHGAADLLRRRGED